MLVGMDPLGEFSVVEEAPEAVGVPGVGIHYVFVAFSTISSVEIDYEKDVRVLVKAECRMD